MFLGVLLRESCREFLLLLCSTLAYCGSSVMFALLLQMEEVIKAAPQLPTPEEESICGLLPPPPPPPPPPQTPGLSLRPASCTDTTELEQSVVAGLVSSSWLSMAGGPGGDDGESLSLSTDEERAIPSLPQTCRNIPVLVIVQSSYSPAMLFYLFASCLVVFVSCPAILSFCLVLRRTLS